MGAMDTRNMHSKLAVNKYLHTVASCWILSIQSHDARYHEYKFISLGQSDEDCLTLDMKALWYFETSVTLYQPTHHSIPKDLNLHRHRCQNLKNRHITCRHATDHPTCQFGTLLSGSSLKFHQVHRMQLLISRDSELTFKVQRNVKNKTWLAYPQSSTWPPQCRY